MEMSLLQHHQCFLTLNLDVFKKERFKDCSCERKQLFFHTEGFCWCHRGFDTRKYTSYSNLDYIWVKILNMDHVSA